MSKVAGKCHLNHTFCVSDRGIMTIIVLFLPIVPSITLQQISLYRACVELMLLLTFHHFYP